MSVEQQQKIEAHILTRFNIIKVIGSGAYGYVWKVQQKKTKKIFALKKIFDAFQHSTDAQRTYREIQILKQINHPNIVKLHQTFKADNNKDVYLVFQFMEADLHSVIGADLLKQVHIRFIIYQLAKALKYLHSGFVIHRDLKPSNILINSSTTIKLCDFGLVRSFAHSNQGQTPTLTEGVATRWYRAPQVLLGSTCYSTPADIWSFGCLIFEIVAKKPMLPGESIGDQIQKIIDYSGYPTEQEIKSLKSSVVKQMLKQSNPTITASNKKQILKDIPSIFSQLIEKMTTFNPQQRITIQQILNSTIVQPFRKKQQQIQCPKIILTQINDNKKLSVDQYRRLIYGIKKSHSISGNQMKIQLGVKKYSSHKKLTLSTELNQKNNINQTNKQKQKDKNQIKSGTIHDTLKHPFHHKFIKPTLDNDNDGKPAKQLKIAKDVKDKQKKVQKKTTDYKKLTFISKNFYTPKCSDNKQYINNNLSTNQSFNNSTSNTCTHSNSNSSYVGTNANTTTNMPTQTKLINSLSAGNFSKNKTQLFFAPSSTKSTSKKHALFKSSKYLISKTQQALKE